MNTFSQRRFLILFVSSLPFLCTVTVPAVGQSRNRPNIIFILADDLGYNETGCYGQQKIATPNIDFMASLGIRFTQFYAGTAVCAPSRASLMTGLHTGHTAVRGNRGYKPEGQFPLPDSSVTIASVLKEQGYMTAAFGKWGLGYPGSTGEPLKKGFTHFFGYNCQTLAHNYYPDHLWQDDQRLELPGNRGKDSIYSADLIHQQALQFLTAQHNQPFFLFLAYTLPHASLHGPHDSLYQRYVEQFHEQPLAPSQQDKGSDYTFEPYPHAAFAAMVSRLDQYVGDILRKVKELGIADNTLILFSSDNGPHHEGGGDPAWFNSSGPYRGIKRDLYEGGIRVPFIALWKGRIRPGTTSDYPATFWDLFPTFEELTGTPLSPAIDGISFLPVLEGKNKAVRQHEYLYWEFHENDGRQAVRWGKWKGVKLQVSTLPDPPLELYDLEKDPGEQQNVADAHPDIVGKLNGFIKAAHHYDKDWPLLKSEIAGH